MNAYELFEFQTEKIKKKVDEMFSIEFPKIIKLLLDEDVEMGKTPQKSDMARLEKYVVLLRDKGYMVEPTVYTTPMIDIENGVKATMRFDLQVKRIDTGEIIDYKES